MVHDLLPVTHPQFFPEYAVEKFRGWLEMTSLYDGVVANSKTTLLEYLAHFPDLPKDFARGSFPLGCDFESNLPDVLERGEGVVTRSDLHFLLIGTIEPRKGHLDALKAFQVLWGRGYTGRLTVVGRWGWGVMDVRERLEAEARINPRLRILNNAGDQELEKIYRTGDCLLAVSECEGFGIPIIEAASRGVSVLARDIPVFREVAGDGADFLSDQEPWPDQILKWDSAFRSKQSANPEGVPYHSWNESSQILMKLILGFDSRARP
jgi:glycosyltransferase involved in cell wall biosynthesis